MQQKQQQSTTLLVYDLPYMVQNDELVFLLIMQLGLSSPNAVKLSEHQPRFIFEGILIDVQDPELVRKLVTGQVQIKGHRPKAVVYKGEETQREIEGPLLETAVFFKGLPKFISKRGVWKELSKVVPNIK